MRTRLRKVIAASPSGLKLTIDVGEASLIDVLNRGNLKVRWASLSSSSYSGEKPISGKPNKKTSDRLSGVTDAINDRKIPRELRGQRNSVRSETDIINVVEQRIWHSMEEGHFENLPGKGKPLNLSSNAHADPAEDTLYRILSRNKCAPEWVELNKEIRTSIAEWRSSLKKALARKESGDLSKWFDYSNALKLKLPSINDMVFRYNLIVPFGRQMFGLNWEKEITRVNNEESGSQKELSAPPLPPPSPPPDNGAGAGARAGSGKEKFEGDFEFGKVKLGDEDGSKKKGKKVGKMSG